MNPQRTFITTVGDKIVSASRYADQESTIPGAENWGWHVVEPRGVGLTPAEPGAAYLTETLMALYGWSHHPTFSEWLMGFPTNWTACEPPATHSCPRSPSSSAGASSNGKRES